MPTLRPLWNWICEEFLLVRGPTRSLALMRMLAAAVCWSRLGATLVPSALMSPLALTTSVLFWVSSTAMFVGLFAQPATFLTGLCAAIVYLSDASFGTSALHHHHVMAQVILTLLLALTPCGRSWSVDRWWAGERALPEIADLWGLRMLQVQLVILYFGAVYEKSYPSWLDGSRMQQVLMSIYTGSEPPSASLQILAASIAIGTVVIEAGLPLVLLLAPQVRVRVGAFAVGAIFHGLVYYLTPVATFSATMAVWLLVLLPPEWFDRISRQVLETEGDPVGVGPDRRALVVAGSLVLVGLPILGRFTDLVPDGRGFLEIGEDACDIRWRNGMHAAGTRTTLAQRLCGRRDLPRPEEIRCVVDGDWESVQASFVCAGDDKTTRRREPAF